MALEAHHIDEIPTSRAPLNGGSRSPRPLASYTPESSSHLGRLRGVSSEGSVEAFSPRVIPQSYGMRGAMLAAVPALLLLACPTLADRVLSPDAKALQATSTLFQATGGGSPGVSAVSSRHAEL